MEYHQTIVLVTPYLTRCIALCRSVNISLVQHWWLSAALGTVLCFFGARLFSASAFWISGMLAGLWSYQLLAGLTGPLPALIIAAALGLICALVLRSLLKIGFFIVGLVLGGMVAGSILGDSIWVIAAMLAGGILSVLFWRVFIMLATAGWGGVLLADTICRWALPQLAAYHYAVPALYTLLSLTGLLYQAGFLRGNGAEGK